MKILVAGAWFSQIHESAVANAFTQLGHQVVKFPWQHYFAAPHDAAPRFHQKLRRAQDKYLWGPLISRLNRDLLSLAIREQPELLFVYRGTHVTAATLHALHQNLPACVLVGYNNDDPFGPGQPSWYWRHFLGALPAYDLVLAYRQHNLEEFKAHGARRVELLRSWFIPEQNRRIELQDADLERFSCDVVFVGHYEADHRVQCLEEIVRRGWKLKLFGPGYDWDPAIHDNRLLNHLCPVQLVWQDDYNRAISGAKIALCFLSKLNRDTYTRRCFEIPAIGTMMMAERTADLATLFTDGQEAAFFNDKNEMAEQIARYLQDGKLRDAVAARGLARVTRDGHDVASRMQQVLAWVGELKEARA